MALVLLFAACAPGEPEMGFPVFEEFCLRGELDLGARLQGRQPSAGEWYPTEWCVVTSSDDDRVRFAGAGRSNPDMEGSVVVGYPAPDRVRLVNADAPPDVEFRGTRSADEARSVRRIDPRRLVEELDQHPEWSSSNRDGGLRHVRWPGSAAPAEVQIQDGRLRIVRTLADLPLRGRVPVVWSWSSASGTGERRLEIVVDDHSVFRAVAERRVLTTDEAEALWRASGGEPPREAPGRAWPALVEMQTETLAPGVHMVRGVRTGFHHLVVETRGGLVVADAPAGWVELHRLPPADLVPGLGISGLSERFIDYLRSHWPGVGIRAVVLTHAHDDHAGGARAFAAEGAEIYAPAEVADFIERALSRSTMPADRLSMSGRRLQVRPVAERVVLADADRPVELLAIGSNPHVDAALGIHVPSGNIFFQSDLHVPRDDAAAPRTDRIEMECWFAEWATQRLPTETTIQNSHGTVALTVREVARYLTHAACLGARP
ncbi:MAG: MBL fold metallo-hydrolase [Gemmatimonadota bacterium]|nr:MBL fold metallo-hydrolase [Gemmatimonadota bacterium]